MPEEKIEGTGIPLFRLTLLGPKYSGKTSLVNSILNNSVTSIYRHTSLPELYYFLYRLSSSDPLINKDYEDINAFCYEIEDTTIDIDIGTFLDLKKQQCEFG